MAKILYTDLKLGSKFLDFKGFFERALSEYMKGERGDSASTLAATISNAVNKYGQR